MSTLAVTLTVIAGLVGISGTIGGAVALIRVNMAKATLELYRQDNDALRSRLETVEGENHEKDQKITTLQGKVAALEEERAILRDLATGHSAVDALGEIILRNHNEVMTSIKALERKVA